MPTVPIDAATTRARNPMSDLVLRERTGKLRELRLSLEALPYRPVSFPKRIRGSVTRYQGNPDATQQVFGPEYKPIQLKGFWKDRWISDREIAYVVEGVARRRLVTAKEVVREIEDMWLSAQELDFAWDDERYRVRIWEFEPTFHRPQDVEWSMTLEVIGPGTDPVILEYTDEFDFVTNAGGIIGAISSWISKAQSAMRRIKSRARQIQDAIDRVDILRRQLDNTIDLAGDIAITPVQLASRIAQSAEDLTETWNSLRRQVDKMDAATEAHSGAVASTGAAWDQVFAGQEAKSELNGASREATSTVQTISRRAVRQLQPRVIRVITVKEATTLRRIAVEVYGGREDAWSQIADFNGLDGPIPPIGTILMIPELQTGAGQKKIVQSAFGG